MTKQKVLRAINEMVLLLDKGRTTNCMARTKDNIICDPLSREAAKWCPLGAAKTVTESGLLYYRTLYVIREFIDRPISFWNDETATSDTEVILAISMAGIAYKEGLI